MRPPRRPSWTNRRPGWNLSYETSTRRGSRQPPGPGRTTSGPASQAHPGRSTPELALPLTVRLQQAFALQASQLPGPTRSLLLVAAADGGSSLAELIKATAILEGTDIGADLLTPAAAARLIEPEGGGLRFRHPLMRSAIYQAADVLQRHAAHAALSEVLTDHPDRRAWHRASATLGPDELAAAGLDQAAARASRRGALEVALAAQQRAAELSETARSPGAQTAGGRRDGLRAGPPRARPQSPARG